MSLLAVLRGPGVELPLHFGDDDLWPGVVQFPGDLRGIVGMARNGFQERRTPEGGTVRRQREKSGLYTTITMRRGPRRQAAVVTDIAPVFSPQSRNLS